MDEWEKICVLMFDEISLKKQLEYNKLDEIIEGFQDLGALGRTEQTNLPTQVWFCGPIHSDNLKNIVVEVVSKLQNIGYIPKVLCDQASNNRALFKLLGACKDQPEIEIGNQRIFTVFDTPHLLKSLRNNFLNKKLTFFADSKQISWQDIEYTYNIDRTSVRAQCMVKMTSVHINPNNFQKMRVKLAAQIFSNSIASAISTAMSVGQLHTKTASLTAEFLKIINNIFMVLTANIVVIVIQTESQCQI
uniref:Uncharacterized protein LOC114347319 n=1 Tax=Diabrotica virgifera virgifera TaxID=50390 RepID=A0A6P7H5L6_DIAVI